MDINYISKLNIWLLASLLVIRKSKDQKTLLFYLYMLLSVSSFRGVGVRMVEPLYQSPSFDGVLPSLVFLQVLYPNYSQNDGKS